LEIDFIDGERAGIVGLSVRVTAKGVQSFSYRYRNAAGRKQRVTVGRYPALSLRDARKLALAKGGEAAKGDDPAERKL
jgi:hypothetical protein